MHIYICIGEELKKKDNRCTVTKKVLHTTKISFDANREIVCNGGLCLERRYIARGVVCVCIFGILRFPL